MKKRIISFVLSLIMVVGMFPMTVFATESVLEESEEDVIIVENNEESDQEESSMENSEQEETEQETVIDEESDIIAPVSEEFEPEETENHLPKLIEGVEDVTVIIQTGFSYQLHDLTGGKIFADEDDTLSYESYYVRKSSDGGESYGEWEKAFREMEFGGINDSVVNSVAGIYVYQFKAYDGKEYSEDIWTLTLDTRDVVPANINFYVGQDQNYKKNGNIYPVLELYRTAGLDENMFDYVGWFEKDGQIVYVYNPQEYTIVDGETDYVIIDEVQYELYGYEKIEFTNSTFDNADEAAIPSGTVVDNYNMFYVSVETGRYSTRGYGYNSATEQYDIYLGGQSMELPREKDIYGNGGNDLYLRLISVYNTSKKVDDTYFTEEDYYVEMIMPVTGSMIHSGDVYIDGNYTKFPFLSWAAGNGSLYNYYAYPYDTENYIFAQAGNQTTPAGNTVVNKTTAISGAVSLKVIVPEEADFGLYLQYNNFNTKEIEPLGEAVVNGDGTKTLTFKTTKGSGNYTWRLSDPTGAHVTKAGWLKSPSANPEMIFTFSEFTNKTSHDFSNMGTQVANRDEGDIQVFLSSSGFKSVFEKTRVRAYRMWQIINTDSANIMLEPDFNIQVLQGNESDIILNNGGNAINNWIDVTPTTTDIVAVNYNALDVYTSSDDYGSHGGFFPATNPERTSVFIVTNEKAGEAVAHIPFNGSKETDRGSNWDYNYDTWFYLNSDENPKLNFTVSGSENLSVSYATVITDSSLKSTLSDWTAITADEKGNYYADLLAFRKANALGGTVIIKMTDSTGTSYALVRVAEMSAHVENVSNPGEDIMPGDDVKVTFEGLYRSINKISGIFNPTTYYLRYSAGETEVNGTLPQYQQMDKASIILTIPEDVEFAEGETTTVYNFTNGYVFGNMYAASSPFQSMYYITDTGVGTNFSAVGVSFVLSRLADIPVVVNEKVIYTVKFDITDGETSVENYELKVTDSEGTVIVAEDDGTYKLGYGEYRYSIVKDGYVCVNGSMALSSSSAKDVVEGIFEVEVIMADAAENAWDGTTVKEPDLVDGVYQISTGAELAWFAETVNGGKTNIKGALIADIDLAGYEWQTIGTNSKKFAGTFDGQNHKVYNFSINYVSDAASSPYKGLFGYTNGTKNSKVEIKNLTVEGNIYMMSTGSVSNAYSAGIVGYASYTDITNVHSKVDIEINRLAGSWNNVAGIAAYIVNGVVSDCSNSGNIHGWGITGGLMGNMSTSTATGCVNTGNITAENGYAGGIAATLQNANCTISACYNVGTIEGGANYSGGIAGKATNGKVLNCFNAGMIKDSGYVEGSVLGQAGNKAAVTENLYYLEGTCAEGIGEVKDETTQTATAVTAENMSSEEFVSAMNTSLENPAFKKGGNYPILVWEVAVANVSINKNSLDLVVGDVENLSATVTPETATNKVVKWNSSNESVAKVDENGKVTAVAEGSAVITAEAGGVTATCSVTVVHACIEEIVPAVEPTCIETGLTEGTKCSICGETMKAQDEIPALGHDMADATCTEPAICKRGCGHTEGEALGHDYGRWVTVEHATMDEGGRKIRTCEVCGHQQSKHTKPLSENGISIIVPGNNKEEFNPNTGAPVFDMTFAGIVVLAAAAMVIEKKNK